MRLRVASAVVLLAALVGALWLGGVALEVLLGVAAMVGLWEYDTATESIAWMAFIKKNKDLGDGGEADGGFCADATWRCALVQSG